MEYALEEKSSNIQEQANMNTLFLNAADTLMGLHTVPNAENAGIALRQSVGSEATDEEKTDLSSSLRQIHQYLLRESNPDYWLEQVADPRDQIDSSMMDMTTAVANERNQQARLIASVIDYLIIDASAQEHSVVVA